MFFLFVNVLDIWMVRNFISLDCVSSFRSKVNIGLVEKVWEYSHFFYCLEEFMYFGTEYLA